jgi:2-methylcitrate dehydratase
MDPVIRAQLAKVEVVADPEIEALFPSLQRVIVTVHTTDGLKLTKQVDFPKGDPRNPLTDREVEEKFEALAGPVLPKAAQEKVKDAVWRLDGGGAVSNLMELLRAGDAAHHRFQLDPVNAGD